MLAWITYQPRGLPRVRHHIQLLCGLPLCRVEIGGHPSGLLRLLLAERVRYLHLAAGCGQQALEDWLLQRYGLACGGAAPSLEVSFCPDAPPSALLLGEGCRCQPVEYILPPTLRDSVPPGIEGECLLAALHRQGRLPASELAVKRIHFGA